VFVYDDEAKTTEPLTGVEGRPASGERPTMDAAGRFVVFQSGTDLYSVDRASGEQRLVVADAYVATARIAGDARSLAFLSSKDLDPTVGNEDLNPEVFLLDLASGGVAQVTDTIRTPFGPDLGAIAHDGARLVLNRAGELAGLELNPAISRVVPVRRPNRAPALEMPESIVAQEGVTSATDFRATDPDEDAVSVFAQLVGERLGGFASSVFADHGDGTARLELSPAHNDAGTYALRIGVFDEGGQVTVRQIPITVEDTIPEGDANCDGIIDPEDVGVLVGALFRRGARSECITVDANDDGRVSVADLGALHGRLAEPGRSWRPEVSGDMSPPR
jgi:hypothetical protein